MTGFLNLGELSPVVEAIHANKRTVSNHSDFVGTDDVALLADIFAADVFDFARRINFSIEDWPIMRFIRGDISAGEMAWRYTQAGFASEVAKDVSAH